MSIQNLISYEVLGAKEEFAGWVSNISPYETPFVSLTGKAPVYNRTIEWQTDRLDLINQNNAWSESLDVLPASNHLSTELHNNYTQILRKVVEVSDTAEALAAHGRPSELEYQIGKATKEIKRDLEYTFLSTQVKDEGSSNNTRAMSGFYDLTAGIDEAEPNTGAITHRKLSSFDFTEEDIFNITEHLYYAGARANIIMFHPTHAKMFSKFFEHNGDGRVEVYLNDDESAPNALSEIVDPLGQRYTLVPNRLMPFNMIYFFHPHDWFQRVLRAPTISELDKTGSTESWMMEMEVTLQHRHRWASGILELTYTPPAVTVNVQDLTTDVVSDLNQQLVWSASGATVLGTKFSSSDTSVATVTDSGIVTIQGQGTATITMDVEFPRGQTATTTATVTVNPFTATVTANIAANAWYKTATAIPATFTINGGSQPINYVWTSSDDTVAEIVNDRVVIHKPGNVIFTVTCTYRNNVTISDTTVFTADPSVITKNNQSYTLKVGEDVDVSGLVTAVPAEANALGYTYELDPSLDQYLTLTGTTVFAKAQPPLGTQSGVTVYSNAEPNDKLFVNVSVNGSTYSMTVSQPIDMSAGDTQTITVELGSDLGSDVVAFATSDDPNTTVNASSVTKVDDTHYTFTVSGTTTNATGKYAAHLYVGCNFPDGINIQAFSFNINAFSVSWTTQPAASGTVGRSFQAKAETTEATATISYSSSDTSVATIDNTGLITYISAGTTEISAKATKPNNDFREIKQNLTLSEPTLSWSVVPSMDMWQGFTDTYLVQTSEQPDSLVYETDDPSVAEFLSTGILTAKLPGQSVVTITAKFGTNEKVLQKTKTIKETKIDWVVQPPDNAIIGSANSVSWHVTGPQVVGRGIVLNPSTSGSAVVHGQSTADITFTKGGSVDVTVEVLFSATVKITKTKTVTVALPKLERSTNVLEIKDGLQPTATMLPKSAFVLNGQAIPDSTYMTVEMLPTTDYPNPNDYITWMGTVGNSPYIAQYTTKRQTRPGKPMKAKVYLSLDVAIECEFEFEITSAHNLVWKPNIDHGNTSIVFLGIGSFDIQNNSTSTITKGEWSMDRNLGSISVARDTHCSVVTNTAQKPNGDPMSTSDMPQYGYLRNLISLSDGTQEHLEFYLTVTAH